jgi:iron(III) transport system substrate-binding protein
MVAEGVKQVRAAGALRASFLVAALVLAACGQQGPSGAEQPSKPASSASAEASAGAAQWEQQWNQLIAAAKAEGKVVVYGPPTPETRDQLTAAFEKRFGIPMEYQAVPGAVAASLLTCEDGAG